MLGWAELGCCFFALRYYQAKFDGSRFCGVASLVYAPIGCRSAVLFYAARGLFTQALKGPFCRSFVGVSSAAHVEFDEGPVLRDCGLVGAARFGVFQSVVLRVLKDVHTKTF